METTSATALGTAKLSVLALQLPLMAAYNRTPLNTDAELTRSARAGGTSCSKGSSETPLGHLGLVFPLIPEPIRLRNQGEDQNPT